MSLDGPIPNLIFAFGILAALAIKMWHPDSAEIVAVLVLLILATRLAARTIHAFVQGVNEGDDPRHAKLPSEPP